MNLYYYNVKIRFRHVEKKKKKEEEERGECSGHVEKKKFWEGILVIML